MKLVLPLPPNAANSRRHWRVVLKEKKAYWNACTLLAMQRGFPKPPPEPMQQVIVRPTLYVWSTMDYDNAVARLKPLLDWIVGHGYIADDSPKHCKLEMPEQFVDRKSPRIEIEIKAA